MDAHPALVISTVSFLGVVALLVLFRRDALIGLRQVGDEVEGTLRRLKAVGWLRPFRRNATPTLRDHGLDVGLDIFTPRGTQDDATDDEVAVWGDVLKAAGTVVPPSRQTITGRVVTSPPVAPTLHIAASPLLRRLATEERGYDARHRAPVDGPREATSSPLVHADTAVWDGPDTAEFRRLVNLPAEVPVLREVLRRETPPQARWAQAALFAAGRAR